MRRSSYNILFGALGGIAAVVIWGVVRWRSTGGGRSTASDLKDSTSKE